MGLSCAITCLPWPGGISLTVATFTKRAMAHLPESPQDGVGFEHFQVMKARRGEPSADLTESVTAARGAVQQQVDRKERTKRRAGPVLVHEHVTQNQLAPRFQRAIDLNEDSLVGLCALAVQDVREKREVEAVREGIGTKVTGNQADPICETGGGNQTLREG